MQPYPHHYQVRAHAGAEGDVTLASEGLPTFASGPPPQFGGRGDQWSPETLLVAAVVDCFILTFRAVARAGRLDWRALDARLQGRLDRVDHVTRFTGFTLHVALTVPPGTAHDAAYALLEKAEHGCLVSRSLNGPVQLIATVIDG